MIERVQIRDALLSDATDISDIDRRVNPSPWTTAGVAQAITDWHGLAMLEGSCCIGFSLYQCVLDEAELLNIAIAPDRQGMGLGAAMLNETLARVRSHDVARLHLEVRASNSQAIGLYRRFGFVQSGERKNYYTGTNGREDALLFELTL